MNRLSAYTHLLVKMSLVLFFVVTVAFVKRADANVRAEDEIQDEELQELTEEEILLNMNSVSADDEESEEEPDITDVAGAGSTEELLPADDEPDPGSNTEWVAAEVTDIVENSGSGETISVSSVSGESAASGAELAQDVQDEQKSDKEKAEEELARYKATQEYVESLLVTHPDHYNKTVVDNARAIPTESDDARYRYITGKKKKIYKVGGMPEGFRSDEETSRQMVTIDVPVWKMNSNGEKYSGYWPLTIHEKLADSCRCIFSDIYLLDIQFPFNFLRGYTYRKVGGVGLVNSKLMSTHAFGVALDINMGDYDNDYFLGKGNDLRNKNNPYCIPDEVIAIFEDYGWFWGGNYDICADTMHFQYFELGFLQYESSEPFPILSRGAENMSSTVIRNLTQRLTKLGYLSGETSSFSKKVEKAVKKFQEDNGLEPNGVVDYATWEPLINKTHFMKYVF
ncbi:MAG: M15 family metallopeptidase [Lachnospiraceae bacterium]|nr:M15 family metallopeptidase [Lachnospiraceae bacterium]